MKNIIFVVVGVCAFGALGYFFFGNKVENLLSNNINNAAQERVTQDSLGADTSNVVGQAALSSKPPAGELWTKRCNNDGDKHCEVFQRLIMKENNQRLVEFAFGYSDNKSNPQAVIILPLGILVANGVTLKIDGKPPTNPIPVRTCTPEGCIVIMLMEQAFVEQMKTSKSLIVGFFDGQSKPINVELPLNGFAEKLIELE